MVVAVASALEHAKDVPSGTAPERARKDRPTKGLHPRQRLAADRSPGPTARETTSGMEIRHIAAPAERRPRRR